MTIAASLNESFRDALVAYYLGEVVPNDTTLADLGLTQKLRTENDLYEFLLLDTQVTQAVETSPVASAIASLQQYVNGALLGMEPGYDDVRFSENLLGEWRDIRSQYPIWAANQQLTWYPSLYIDPSLRMKKSSYFQQLENDINQNRITIDTTQEAVQSYLASFEEVANLTIINGYISGIDFKESVYYFIGKSRAEGAYYWRSVNMAERSLIGSDGGPKSDNPNPGAWSDWKKANLPVSEAALEHTIRPVYFNNRLFVVWAELLDGVETLPAPTKSTPTATAKIRINLTYKKYDDSWSAPQCYQEFEAPRAKITLADGKVDINTIAIVDTSTTPEALTLAVFSGYVDRGNADGSADLYAVLRTLKVDKNFNSLELFPARGVVDTSTDPETGKQRLFVMRMGRLLANTNAGRFQFPMTGATIRLKGVSTTSPHSGTSGVQGWNHAGWQSRIKQIAAGSEVSYNAGENQLTVSTSLEVPFQSEVSANLLTLIATGEHNYSITLNLPDDDGTSDYLLARGGSFITSTGGAIYKSNFRGELRVSLPGSATEFPLITETGSSNYQFVYFNFVGGRADVSQSYVNMRLIRELKRSMGSTGRTSMRIRYYGDADVITQNSTALITTYAQYQQFISHSPSMVTPTPANIGTRVTLRVGSEHSELEPSRHSQSTTININPETLRPDWAVTWVGASNKFTVIHGVYVSHLTGTVKTAAGYCAKATEIELESVSASGALVAPKISYNENSTLGIAEFIDFTRSTIALNDQGTARRNPIRMNTLFARNLIERANIALENLLSWSTQHLPEPALGEAGEQPFMDFKGANGLYFWELFFHLPLLISHRLNTEQQFKDAEHWLAFIFDPSRRSDDNGRPDYWNVRPLVDAIGRERSTRAPVDPDGIASDNPVHYRKAVYSYFIKNLIDRGDAAYRQLTPDSLNEAKLWYVRVQDLLGPRPDKRTVSSWTPMTLAAFTQSVNGKLRVFERRLNEEARIVAQSAAENDGRSLVIFKQPPLALMPFTADSTVPELDNAHLRVAMNRELVQNWDTVEARLRNLRHNRTLDGKPLQLSLFAAPLDPRALLSAFGSGATGAGLSRLQGQEIPHYRFNVMHNRASNAVEHLIQFGSTLLSLLERKENAQLQEMQQQQAWEMAKQAITLQQLVQQVESEGRKALLANRAIVEGRLAYYGKLAQEVVNEGEVAAGALHLQGRVAEGVACVSEAIGEGLKVPPNQAGAVGGVIAGVASGAIVGASSGGWRLEGVTGIATAVAKGIAAGFHGAAEALDRTEQYRRRHQEWMQAEDQAQREIEQIDAQLAVHDEQAKVTAEQLRQAVLLVDQAATTYQFLSKRFTNAQLYQWLNGQFATFYYQAYDITLSLCLAAEACWQYEMADFKTRFIQPGAWKDSYRGLTAGESLKLNLMKMEAAYLQRNARSFEITKTVSVRRLLETQARSWSSAVMELGGAAGLQIELADALFKADYPDHYLRRIKRVSVTLPAVLGPYEDIAAVLTQTYSKVEMTATEGENVWENMRASQQIALSRGVDDDGMFTLNFDDERYLPFEGTGAVSNWNLRFTRPTPELLASLSDVIVRVSYTAKTA
jgi:hypothetical protein